PAGPASPVTTCCTPSARTCSGGWGAPARRPPPTTRPWPAPPTPPNATSCAASEPTSPTSEPTSAAGQLRDRPPHRDPGYLARKTSSTTATATPGTQGC